ncbi:hypothetical protein M427DRAFT_63058 [Gonapodya prolifera JEL478]|uniref:MYND-type domain-containing protein n=1 Tax=Gonapodya prolifera (strain JEL478) TaxID=1344416 RepID=A0A139A0E0_GONPJ|nr:hypothetical protein M427DRAFT_63058 [Gonapodya prolifera JEL478]|eukprot:KXS10005.1 hypothetical protein M427DRAFT_63058 [Gonapodya prolifera JEL478]
MVASAVPAAPREAKRVMEAHVEQLVEAMETRNPHQLACSFGHAFECSSCLGIYWAILDALCDHVDSNTEFRSFAFKTFMTVGGQPYLHSILDGLAHIIGRLRGRSATKPPSYDALFDAFHLASWLRLTVVRNPEVPTYLASLPELQWKKILDLSVALYLCRQRSESSQGETASAILGILFHIVGYTLAVASAPHRAQACEIVRRHSAFSRALEALTGDPKSDPGLTNRAIAIFDQLDTPRSSHNANPRRVQGACGHFYCDGEDPLASPEPGNTRIRVCEKCNLIRYCSSQCQREDWQWHKAFCGRRDLPTADKLKLPKGWDDDGHFVVMKQVGIDSPKEDYDSSGDSFASEDPVDNFRGGIRSPEHEEEEEDHESVVRKLDVLVPVPAHYDSPISPEEEVRSARKSSHGMPEEELSAYYRSSFYGSLFRTASSTSVGGRGLGLSSGIPTPPISANRSFSTPLGGSTRLTPKSREQSRERDSPPNSFRQPISTGRSGSVTRKSSTPTVDTGYGSRNRSLSRRATEDSRSRQAGPVSRRTSDESLEREWFGSAKKDLHRGETNMSDAYDRKLSDAMGAFRSDGDYHRSLLSDRGAGYSGVSKAGGWNERRRDSSPRDAQSRRGSTKGDGGTPVWDTGESSDSSGSLQSSLSGENRPSPWEVARGRSREAGWRSNSQRSNGIAEEQLYQLRRNPEDRFEDKRSFKRSWTDGVSDRELERGRSRPQDPPTRVMGISLKPGAADFDIDRHVLGDVHKTRSDAHMDGARAPRQVGRENTSDKFGTDNSRRSRSSWGSRMLGSLRESLRLSGSPKDDERRKFGSLKGGETGSPRFGSWKSSRGEGRSNQG